MKFKKVITFVIVVLIGSWAFIAMSGKDKDIIMFEGEKGKLLLECLNNNKFRIENIEIMGNHSISIFYADNIVTGHEINNRKQIWYNLPFIPKVYSLGDVVSHEELRNIVMELGMKQVLYGIVDETVLWDFPCSVFRTEQKGFESFLYKNDKLTIRIETLENGNEFRYLIRDIYIYDEYGYLKHGFQVFWDKSFEVILYKAGDSTRYGCNVDFEYLRMDNYYPGRELGTKELEYLFQRLKLQKI